MSFSDVLRALMVICVMARPSHSQQTSGGNVPNSPMWPIFSQLLSTQTSRTLQDINTLGLSDPTIKQLWTAYSASLAKMTQTPAPTPTTPPPLPDLYQTSYSFSSSGNQAATNQVATNQVASATSSTATSKGADNTVLYNDILNLINQLSGPGSAINSAAAPRATSTSAQDVMNAYAQLSGSSGSSSSGSASSSNSNPMQAMMEQLATSSGGSTSTGGTDYQALIQKYMASMGGGNAANLLNQMSGSSGSQATSSSNPNYQSLIDQYNSIMNQKGSGGSSTGGTSSSGTSYEQLLQQYNQIMGGKSSGTPAASGGAQSALEQYLASLSNKGSGTAPATDQLLQLYSQMNGGNTPNTNSSAASSSSSPPSAQETFEKQLSTFFPQFKSLFPQSSTVNHTAAPASGAATSSGSNPATSNTAQMIFDAILFAPPQTGAGGTTSATSTKAPSTAAVELSQGATGQGSPVANVQNLINSGGGAEALLTNHVQNVFKTRASREMGCRFLPELLELDLLPTAPINCMNRCPFPYVNSQQFGMYCVCCPPGVNEQAVGMMSLVRGNSYMETPLAVVS